MIRIATRGSALALWQAEAVKHALAGACPGEDVALLIIRTSGDELQEHELAALLVVNVFTAEVDRAVQDGRADVGVHSLKDLGTQLAGGLTLAATLERGPLEDVLVAPRAGKLADLPAGATVGTGSLRRRAMLLRERPDLRCVNLRGNVETRLAKVERGEVEAAILARAGLERLGLGGAITQILDDQFLPAAGQGLIGITCRASDERVASALRSISHAPSFAAGIAERALLAALHAGCHAPVGALAVVQGGRLALRCRVLSRDGTSEIAGAVEGPVADASRLGQDLARRLLADGAGGLIGEERG